MAFPTSRRQNTSCDPCRRSKRRCLLLPDAVEEEAKCLNCTSLGYACTFEFARTKSRAARSKKRKNLEPEPEPEHGIPTTLEPDTGAANTDLLSDLSWPDVPQNGLYDFSFDFFLGDVPHWEAAMSIPDASLQSPLTWPGLGNVQQEPSTPLKGRNEVFSGFWRGSPIRLLNSTVALDLQEGELGAIYDSVMTMTASRFLSYGCNPFAGPHKYILESESRGRACTPNIVNTCVESAPADSHGQLPSPAATSPAPNSTPQEVKGITLIGVARFLDHFAPLYGNKLAEHIRQQDEDDLKAVVYAFALQHGASDPPSSEMPNANIGIGQSKDSQCLYRTAWLAALSRLRLSMTNSSFIHIYSVFLFHMTAVPEDQRPASASGEQPNELLDHALRAFLRQKALVDQYCAYLNEGSIYQVLMCSSARILHWYGFIRDTIASLTTDRKCVLKDDVEKASDFPSFNHFEEQQPLETEIQRVSQQGVGQLFILFRRIISLREYMAAPIGSIDTASLAGTITASKEAVDTFFTSYGIRLTDYCSSFHTLTERSKVSIFFLSTFWSLGVLYLVEEMRRANDIAGLDLSYRDTQQAAISICVTAAQRIKEASAEGGHSIMDGADNVLPFVSHHANTDLMGKAIVKVIEHIIHHHHLPSSASILHQAHGPTPFGQYECMSSIAILLWCLMKMDTTVSGSLTAQPALRRLLREYGDIIMDSWSHDTHN